MAQDDDTDNVSTITQTAAARVLKLGQMRVFDGELARRELRDELYPLFMTTADALVELHGRMNDLEDGAAGIGIDEALANDMLTGLARGRLATEIAIRTAPVDSDDMRAALEVRAWFDENEARIIDEINTVTIADQVDDDEDVEED
jgi:hypothetical protein